MKAVVMRIKHIVGKEVELVVGYGLGFLWSIGVVG
jgi:hypothetical protein